VTKSVQNRRPAAKRSARAFPPPRGAAKPSILPAAVVLFVVLAAVVYFNKFKGERDLTARQAAAKLEKERMASEDAIRGDRAAEQAAVRKLRDRKVLVIEEACDPNAPNDRHVTSINFCGQPVDDDLLAQLRHLPALQSLNASDCKITGGQLKYLAGLNQMASLVLSNTAIDDKGLENISLLESIESLILCDTAISDAGLDHVAELRNLKILDLSKTKVTDAGIKKLLPLASLEHLLLAETSLTDAGLDQLASLPKLRRLTIYKTNVTQAGTARLKQAMPRLTKIDFDGPES
jgi:hypothetical protein